MCNACVYLSLCSEIFSKVYIALQPEKSLWNSALCAPVWFGVGLKTVGINGVVAP